MARKTLHNQLSERLALATSFPNMVLGGRMRACIAALYAELFESGFQCVVLPANVCPTLVTAVSQSGSQVLLAPTDPDTGAIQDHATAQLIQETNVPGSVMLVQSYGFLREFPTTMRAARSKGWFVVENDTMATRILSAMPPEKSDADVLVTSFGAGKAISAGVGGVAMCRDSALAASLEKRIRSYPPLEKHHGLRDEWLIKMRRFLRQGPDGDDSWLRHGEFLLELERADLCHSLPNDSIDRIMVALDVAPRRLETSLEADRHWLRALGTLDGIRPVAGNKVNPWRSMWLVASGRDRVVRALRDAGFDAGTNYPDVREYFPSVLASRPDGGARQWSDTVLNLWVDERYDQDRIEQAAVKIERSLDADD